MPRKLTQWLQKIHESGGTQEHQDEGQCSCEPMNCLSNVAHCHSEMAKAWNQINC
jgi:hypothetical protein